MGRLFWKFFFCIFLAQLLAAISIGGVFWIKQSNRDKKVAIVDRGPPAAFMVSAAASTLQFGGKTALQDLIKNIDGRHRIFAVGEDGRELLGRAVDPRMVENAKRIADDKDEQQVVRVVRTASGQNYLLFSTIENQSEVGPPFMHSGNGGPFLSGEHLPTPRVNPFVQMIPEIATIVASLIFAALLAWYFSKPIRILRAAFRAAEKGDLETKIGPIMGKRRDELTDLGHDFDNMAAQLHALMEGQKRLLHDVSHELRSPLARMQVAIGLAHQQPEKIGPSMERIERESIRMDKLVGELLTLSRLEANVKTSTNVDIDMEELITEIVENAQFEATVKNCKVELLGNCRVTLNGRPELIYRAIENVLRNAVRHTVAGSSVTFDSHVDFVNQQLILSVLDHGPGVSEQTLHAMFEPFFRGDDNMKSADRHGLGLAIAQRVITMHEGTISAINRNEGGLCVNITLPITLSKV